LVITKQILDEKPGLAKSQPKIKLADSIDNSAKQLLDGDAYWASRDRTDAKPPPTDRRTGDR